MEKHSTIQQKTQKSYSTIGPNQQIENMHHQQEDIPQNYINGQNNSMKKLCTQFYKFYKNKSSCIITINDLSEQFQVSKRRIYDLLGMLLGFQCVMKAKSNKGSYIWLGIKNLDLIDERKLVLKGIVLKDIAYALKQILSTNENGLNFKQLTCEILKRFEEKDRLKLNQSTLIRRIYECLKIMKDFELIIKLKKTFKWEKIEEFQRMEEQQVYKKRKSHSKQKILKNVKKNNKKVSQNILINVGQK